MDRSEMAPEEEKIVRSHRIYDSVEAVPEEEK